MKSSKIHGRHAISMLREIFNIPKDFHIKDLTIHASCDDAATITINSMLMVNNVDITSKQLSCDTVTKEYKYEVSVKRIEL